MVLLLLILFRERVAMITTMAANSTRQVTDTEVLEFYNLATSKVLTGLEVCTMCSNYPTVKVYDKKCSSQILIWNNL